MTSGTQGFRDLSGDINPIGSVMSRVIEARRLAKEEYDFAQKEAEKYQTSLQEAGIPKGYFFKRALSYKFGGEYAENTSNKIKNIRSQASQIKGSVAKKGYSKSERVNMFLDAFDQKASKSKFRDRFTDLYKDSFVDDPLTRPMSSLVKPGSKRRFKKAVFGDDLDKKKRIQKEDILKVLAGISDSLNATARSISENTSGISANLIQAHNVQNELVQQIKYNGSTIEDKLDQIVKALSTQNQIQDQAVKNEKNQQQESQLEQQTISSQDVSFDDLQTAKDESNEPDITSVSRPVGGAPSVSTIPKPGMDYPQLEKGGIVSGPDTGYPVMLHGTEAVIPLKNRSTDNISGNEVTKKDGSVNPVSKMMPQYERGTSPQFNKIDFSPTSTTQSSVIAQDVVNAMTLPKKAVGADLLSSTTDYMNSIGSGNPQLNSEIAKVQRPIAKTFGLSASTVNVATKNKSFAGKKEEDKKDSTTDKKKNILEQIGDSVKELFDGILEKINGGTPPGDNPPGSMGDVDYSNLKSGDISTTAGKVANLYDEFRSLGWTEDASKRMIAEIGREGGMQNKNLFGTHTDPSAGIPNTGMISWNRSRRDKLVEEARKAGVWDESKGQIKETAQGLRFQARFLDAEMRSSYTSVSDIVRDSGAKGSDISKAFKEDFIVYRTDQGYSGGPDSEYGSNKTEEWYKTLKLDTTDLEATRGSVQTQTASQRMQRNYGQGVESTVRFKLNGQWYNAVKTTNGFDFYDEGSTPLPLDDTKVTDPKKLEPLIREFDKLKTKSLGDQALLTPTDQRQQQVARAQGIAKDPESDGFGQVAVLNIGNTSKQPSAGSELQNTTSDVIGSEPSPNPLVSLYQNPINSYDIS